MFDSCICIDADDPVTLMSRRKRTARKQHQCCECRHPIQPGQQYEVDATVHEGRFKTFKTCETCLRIRLSLFACGWCYGDLWKSIHKMLCGLGEAGDEDDFCICP
jgi:hypothetical protein